MGFDDAPPPAYSPDVGVPVEHNTRSMSRQEREAFIKSTDLPPGLGEAVLRSCDEFALRIWVIDNSGSMGTNDGTRFSTGAGGRPQLVKCTRWQELGDALSFVAKMAAYLAAPTEFRLLNPPAQGQQVLQCGVGEPTAELRAMESMITSAPSARTPLCAQIRAVVERVRAEAPRLRASGKRCIVVIASDGASTDGDVEVALRPLQELPVWVVVRLCTDQEDVVDYWSRIDRDLELEMDVLDDLKGEAQEIAKKNPFVTYGSHLHRLREWGTAAKVLDLLDERLLAPAELMDLVDLIAGCDAAPDLARPTAASDVAAVTKFVEAKMRDLPKTWCPVQEKEVEWIKVKAIAKAYKGSACSIS